MWTHDSQIGDTISAAVRLNNVSHCSSLDIISDAASGGNEWARESNQALGSTTAGNESEEQQACKAQREAQQLDAHTWTPSSLEHTKNMYRRQKEVEFRKMLRRWLSPSTLATPAIAITVAASSSPASLLHMRKKSVRNKSSTQRFPILLVATEVEIPSSLAPSLSHFHSLTPPTVASSTLPARHYTSSPFPNLLPWSS